MAKEKNLPYIVILEDDIHFTNIPKFQELLKHFMDEIKDDYDVYLLAGNLRHPIEKITQNILKIYTSYTTTGYIVKQHYYDTIISNIKEGIVRLIKNPLNGMNAIDVNWIQLQKKINGLYHIHELSHNSPIILVIKIEFVNYDHLMLDQNKISLNPLFHGMSIDYNGILLYN